MKRVIASAILLCMLCCMLPATVEAAYGEDSILICRTIEYFEDGSSIEISVYEEPATMRASDYMKSGSKVYRARNIYGDIMYTFTVKGVFSVDEGVAATCTSASYSTSIIESAWTCSSASATNSGNRAIANGTFKLIRSGITEETDNVQVVLTCDDLGNLS